MLLQIFVTYFSDIPPDVITVTVSVFNKGKRAKDSEVAEITIDLNNLANGEEVSCQFIYCSCFRHLFIDLIA